MMLITVYLIMFSAYFAAVYSSSRQSQQVLFGVASLFAITEIIMLGGRGGWWLVPATVLAFVATYCIKRTFTPPIVADIRGWLELQSVVLLALFLARFLSSATASEVRLGIIFMNVGLAIAALILMVRHLLKHSWTKPTLAEDDLPTVSLLIPARNEGHALFETLQKATAITYPKLEILVLDDRSQDSTPDIIRKFAHDGVRFIEGQHVPEGWYGKNYALEQLRKVANGELLLFADVDVHLEPETIHKLVQVMRDRGKRMLSVLPTRRGFDPLPTIFRPLFEYWLTLIPYGALQSARVYSSCFIVDRDYINHQSFAQNKSDVFPERALANQLKIQGIYDPIIATRQAGISIRKRASSHFTTQQRVLFPLLGHSEIGVALFSVVTATMIIATTIIVADVFMLALLTLLWSTPYALYNAVHFPVGVPIAYVQFIPLLMVEVALSIVSYVKYTFTRVTWKDRQLHPDQQNYLSASGTST